ncbi:histidine kinase [Pseudoalteromonas citrea]|uniref:histidine kinase n=2 Tax=Pseudoalteromonas citrea TaxID=43655 RepID=A0AAD4AEG9_9GAMM|nr:PAS domain-containing hybrid sensor histidine kinase/response regulator [Pseudoalteromonas citrea]KAF7764465.1 histidine kinase [Pseudoalteromonas citrea]
MQLLLNTLPLMRITSSGDISTINEGCRLLLQLSENEMRNKPLSHFFAFSPYFDHRTIVLGESATVTAYYKNRFAYSLQFYHCEPDKYDILVINNQAGASHLSSLSSTYILDTAISCANIGIWRFDTSFNNVYFSDSFYQLIKQLPSDGLSWDRFTSLIHTDDQIQLKRLFIESQPNMPLSFEFRMTISGQVHWYQILANQPNNYKNYWYGTLQECSQEKQMTKALNEANESRRIALEAGKIGSWRSVKQDQHWEWAWDEQANAIFQMDISETTQISSWLKNIHPDDISNAFKAFRHALKTGKEFEHECRYIQPSNNTIHLLIKGLVTQNSVCESIRIDGVVIDQTTAFKTKAQLQEVNLNLEEKVRARTAELDNALKHAETANKSKSDFLSMMSHELRTPMNVIIGALDLLTLQDNNLEEQELLDTASISANNLVSILNDILDITKIEAGKLELDCVDFDLSELIYNILVVFGPVARAKGVNLSVFESTLLPAFINTDDNRVRQVLFNLISNAIKFCGNTDDKAGSVIINIDWQPENELIHTLIVSVQDNGIGIDKATQKKLFTPFTQADKTTTRRFGGTGLGLAICGRLIDLMGGQLDVQSEPLEGSTFTVRIPIWHSQPRKQALPLVTITLVTNDENELHTLHLIKMLNTTRITQVSPWSSLKTLEAQQTYILIINSPYEQTQLNILKHIQNNAIILINGDNLAPIKRIVHNVPISFLSTQTFFSIKKLLDRLNNSAIYAAPNMCEADFDLNLDATANIDEEPSHHNIERLTSAADHNANPPALITPKNLEVAHSSATILLVEDNPFNQKLMTKQLTKLGYTCDIAQNGELGLSQWQEKSYTLILTDCHMPEMDGYEMTELIRQKEQRLGIAPIPIIAVTGAAMKGDRDYCLSKGMSDFISKPITLDKFKTVIGRWYA